MDGNGERRKRSVHYSEEEKRRKGKIWKKRRERNSPLRSQ